MRRDKYGYAKRAMSKPIENREELLREFLKHNHEEYLAKPLKIGFTQPFPEHTDTNKVEARITIPLTEGAQFETRFTKLTFGPNNEHEVSGVVTDRFEIKRTGPMAGWGSHGYIDEARVMNKAALQLCKEQGLMICDYVCSWPVVKLIVQKPEDAHLRLFKNKSDANSKAALQRSAEG